MYKLHSVGCGFAAQELSGAAVTRASIIITHIESRTALFPAKPPRALTTLSPAPVLPSTKYHTLLLPCAFLTLWHCRAIMPDLRSPPLAADAHRCPVGGGSRWRGCGDLPAAAARSTLHSLPGAPRAFAWLRCELRSAPASGSQLRRREGGGATFPSCLHEGCSVHQLPKSHFLSILASVGWPCLRHCRGVPPCCRERLRRRLRARGGHFPPSFEFLAAAAQCPTPAAGDASGGHASAVFIPPLSFGCLFAIALCHVPGVGAPSKGNARAVLAQASSYGFRGAAAAGHPPCRPPRRPGRRGRSALPPNLFWHFHRGCLLKRPRHRRTRRSLAECGWRLLPLFSCW